MCFCKTQSDPEWRCDNSAHLHHLTEPSTLIRCGYSEVVMERTSLEVPLMDINSDGCCFGQLCHFKTFPVLERLHLCRRANPLTFLVLFKCIHTADLTLLVHYAVFNCPRHIFHRAQISVCREANLGCVTQCGRARPLCSATALCFPPPPLKHMEEKAHGGMTTEDVIPHRVCSNTMAA